MGKNKRPAFVGESRPCLYFILATCVAIGYHFAVNKWLTNQSHAQLFLPLVVGALAFLAAKCSTKKMKDLESQAALNKEQLDIKRNEVAQLRVRLVDVERSSRNARREIQRMRQEVLHVTPDMGSKFETTFHATPDPMLLADLETGLVTDVNESFLHLLDFDWSDVYNSPVSSLFTWATVNDASTFANALVTGETASNLQAVSDTSNGLPFVALVSMCSIAISGKRTVIIAVRDYSDLHAAQHEIRILSKALEQSPAGIAVLSIDGNVEYVNTRFTQITGYASDEIHGTQLPFLQNQIKSQTFSWSMLAHDQEWRNDIYTTRKDKTRCWLSVSISPVTEHEEFQRYVLILEDITQKKEQEQRIQHMAMHDGLTNLPNRRHFNIQLKRFIELQHRSQIPFALVFLDLNKFKEINDNRGHKLGDEVLKKTAHRLSQILREVDFVARPGGDEFLLMLSGIQTVEDLSTTLMRIAYHIAQPMEFSDSTTLSLTAAMGVALCPEHGCNPDELLSKADHAMYNCKRTPNSPFSIWDISHDMLDAVP